MNADSEDSERDEPPNGPCAALLFTFVLLDSQLSSSLLLISAWESRIQLVNYALDTPGGFARGCGAGRRRGLLFRFLVAKMVD